MMHLFRSGVWVFDLESRCTLAEAYAIIVVSQQNPFVGIGLSSVDKYVPQRGIDTQMHRNHRNEAQCLGQ
jgi:hypothetical protein